MNAALIAACAVNSAPIVEPNRPLKYFTTNSPEWYVSLNVRLYLHFEPCSYVRPYFTNGMYVHEVVRADAMTFAMSRSHLVKSTKMHKVDASYYLDVDNWEEEKELMIAKYCGCIKRKYGITPNPDEVVYTHQFCWDWEYEEEE